jgi:hypothetical protein
MLRVTCSVEGFLLCDMQVGNTDFLSSETMVQEPVFTETAFYADGSALASRSGVQACVKNRSLIAVTR